MRALGVEQAEQGQARGVDGPAARVVLVALQRAKRLADVLAGFVPAFEERVRGVEDLLRLDLV